MAFDANSCGGHLQNICLSHLNVRSITVCNDLGRRTDHINEFICKALECHLVACTETHLDNSVGDDEIRIDGYYFLRKDPTRHGGGICIYLKEELNFRRLHDLEVGNSEIMWVQINWPNFCLLFGVCYRPPGQNSTDKLLFMSNLEQSLIMANSYLPNSVILVGDFNDPCVVWDSAHPLSDLGNNLVSLTNSLGLSQLIHEPTRGNVILDLLFTSTPDLFVSTSVLDPIHELDHSPITGKLTVQVTRKGKLNRHIWHYDRGDYESIKVALDETPWHILLANHDDVDDMVHVFSNILVDVCKEFIPNFRVNINPSDKQGMTMHVKRLFRLSSKLNRRAKLSLSQIDMDNYKLARNKAKNEWRKTRYLHYLKVNNRMTDPDTTPKQWWKIASAQMGTNKIKSIPCLVVNDVIISDDRNKCNALNQYFISFRHHLM